MQILIDGKEIKNLTVTNIAIWNSGYSIIERDDIPEKSPLAIKLLTHAGKIISAKILGQTNIGNGASINTEENNYATITFDYLNRNDGFVLQIIHTENTITSENILGEIKGIGQTKNNFNLRYNGYTNIAILAIVFIMLSIYTFRTFYYAETNGIGKVKFGKTAHVLFCLLMTIIVMYITSLLLNFHIRNFSGSSIDPYKISVPNNLQNFFIPSE